MNNNHQTVGLSASRLDGPDKVTGRALYTSDIKMDGMLEISLVRSPVAHALLKKISSPQMPEGCYLFTAKDLDKNYIPSIFSEQPTSSGKFFSSTLTTSNGRSYTVDIKSTSKALGPVKV